MSSSEHIGERAAGLASLPVTDPERRAAWEHARGCVECATALAEGERLMTLLSRVPLPLPPSPEALHRASAQIIADLEGAPRRARIALLAASISAWIIPVVLSKRRAPLGGSWALSLLVSAAAAASAALAVTLGGLLVGLIPLASLLFSLHAGSGTTLAAAVGIKCMLTELASASVPLAVASFLARRGRLSMGRALCPAIGGAGALAGHAALHIGCPVASALPHLLVFHTGGVLLAAGLGVVLSRSRLIRQRS